MLYEHYKLLSVIFSYPEEEHILKEAVERLSKISDGIQEIDDLNEFVMNSEITAIQEEYVNAFELQPLCAPYISHHIYGESYKKGEYMIFLKEIYRKSSFIPSVNELPDHIAVVSEFLSFLTDGRRKFLSCIMPGLEKMKKTVEETDTPYRQAVLLFYKLCSAELFEFEEVIECSTC